MNEEERKRFEERLKESEKKYRKIVENIYDIIYSYYADGTIDFVSPNVLSIAGYKPEEIIGHNFIEFVHPDDREHVLNDYEKTIKTGEEFPTILRLLKKDGSNFYVEEFGKVIRQGDKLIGVTGVLRDITERKKAEDKLKCAQKELEIKTKNLEETNTALKILMEHQDSEKKIVEKNLLTNVKNLILPYLGKIKLNTSDERQLTYITIIETNLSEITKPFITKLANYHMKLTPTEIQIAELIRDDKTTKEIAKLLDISETTVFSHRRHIRAKLGLKKKSTNLKSYLQYITSS